MKKALALTLILFLLGITILSMPQPLKAQARSIVVPTDYLNLSSAIKSAQAGDTIIVKGGVYIEGQLEINKQLTIISEIPNQAELVIQPSMYPIYRYYGYATMVFNNSISIKADNVKISGFKITNQKPSFLGNATVSVDLFGSISAFGNQIQITNNVIGTKEMRINLKLTGNNNQAVGNTLNSVIINGDNQVVSNNNLEGIIVSGSYNKISNNKAGDLILNNANNNIATDNSFTKEIGNGEIRLNGADYNTFSNNTVVAGTTVAIAFAYPDNKGGSHNVFIYNTIEGASLWGILLGLGDYNVFFGNLIANNGGLGHDGYGLAIGGYQREVNNNLFYGNIFANNSRNFGANWEVVGSNSFDNGSMGNYWSDYLTKYPNAVEIGTSGIGNIPYQVYGNTTDKYPLVKIPDIQKNAKITIPTESANPALTPSPSVPELSWLVILPMIAIMFSAVLLLRQKSH